MSAKPRQGNLSSAYFKAGYCYKRAGKFDKALANLKSALAIDLKLETPKQIIIRSDNIASVYKAMGKYSLALQFYDEALQQARKSGRETDAATVLNNIGLMYYNWGKSDTAIDYYNRALQFHRNKGNQADISAVLNNIGLVYEEKGQYSKAIKVFQEALAIDRKRNKLADIAMRLNNMGLVYKAWGQFNQAIKHYQQALKINRQLNRISSTSDNLNNIGAVYYEWGQYDQAVDFFEQALKIAKERNRYADIAVRLNNIGMVYSAWGKYDKALEYYRAALKIDIKMHHKHSAAVRMSNMGEIFREIGKYDQALEFLEQSLKIERELGRQPYIAIRLNNIGVVYSKMKQYEKAVDYYHKALAIDKQLNRRSSMAAQLNNIGEIYRRWKRYDKATEYYRQALTIAREAKRQASIAIYLNNLGVASFNQARYTQAIPYFNESVAIIEKLRKTATGDVRRDYLASQIITYQFLTACYLRTKNYNGVFNTIELSRAKTLSEQIAGADVLIPSLQSIQKNLPQDTAVLVFANSDQPKIIQALITKKEVKVSERTAKAFVQDLIKSEKEQADQDNNSVKSEERNKLDEKIVGVYRSVLTNLKGSEAAKKSGHIWYRLLIGNLSNKIRDKLNLIIIPDGVLYFIPFETLIDGRGRYLAQNHNISYSQSLSVLELIHQRNYESDRKPIVAFGGAVYDERTYKGQTVRNQAQLSYLQKQVNWALKKDGSMQKYYAALNRGGFSNLPGTLFEVNAIGKILNNSDVLTGLDVSESHIKNMSASGTLDDYKVIHFATHGLVTPQIPELSALVLSLSDTVNAKTGEDGYLRVGEIVDLKIKADFVNLSACQTALGKLYKGEGVVGLTQSFLIAGANGLSVSLWPVADRSTALFMTGLYSLVNKEKMSYAMAITEVKRRFIEGKFGKQWQAPVFWAPFVYYGR